MTREGRRPVARTGRTRLVLYALSDIGLLAWQ